MIKIIYEKVKPFIPLAILMGITLYYSKILTPFVISAIVAYLLNPLIKVMEKKLKREVALTIIMGVLIIAIIAGILIIIPGIIKEVVNLVNNFPDYINKIKEYRNINFPYKNEIIEKITMEISTISKIILSKSTGIFMGGMTIIGYIVSVPIFTFYMLKDKEIMCNFFWNFIPDKNKRKISETLKKIDTRMQGFIKGQFLDFIGLAILLAIGFTIVGVKNGIALSIICAAFNLVPYVGMIFSLILVGGVSWFQNFEIMFLVKAVGIFVVIQFFENMIMAPNLLGSNAKVHPLAIVIAIMIFGGTFGIAGVILAIPGLIVIDVLMNIRK
jgi:predicted PurR-regulated permease PerM